MHITWDVSVWNLVSWVIAALGFAFAAGKASQLLTVLVGKVGTLEATFTEHQQSNAEHFEAIAASQADLRVEVARLKAIKS